MVEIHRITAANAHHFERLGHEVFDEAIVPERLAAYLAQPGHLMLLAVEEGLTVGQCAAVLHLHPDKPTELYIDELGTASTHRRQGIARALTQAMLAWGKELGAASGWLGTEPDNLPARRLYENELDADEIDTILYDFDL